jgi:hypothetical protein
MRNTISAGLCFVALAACGRQDAGDSPAGEARTSARAQPASAIAPGLAWTTRVTGVGVSMTLTEANGAPVMQLACTRDPAEMTLVVDRFRPVGSEDRLTLGVGEEPFVFVADLRTERPSGVEAAAPISEALLERLEAAQSVSAVYGAQQVGPHIPPDAEAARIFSSACRAVAGRPGASSLGEAAQEPAS